jgi:diaminopimelate decarboxylase
MPVKHDKYQCPELVKQIGAGLDLYLFMKLQLGLKAGFAPKIFCSHLIHRFPGIRTGERTRRKFNIDNISILEQFGNSFRFFLPVVIG